MSGNVSEHQVHHTLPSVAPRKRPRQESDCDVDSGVGDSERSGGSGSGSSESGENGDGRQGGSQKRARSQGLGEPEVSRDSISWPRNAGSRSTSNQMHASTSSTRLPSGSTTTSRYLNSSEAIQEPPFEESFIPLPLVPTSDVQRESLNYNDNHPVRHTSQDDIARSMAFDEQLDVLRRSPDSLSSSPMTNGASRSVEIPNEANTTLEPESSASSEGTSSESTGEPEASEPEPRAWSEAEQPNSSGRLHALADTASMHSRILHAPTSRMARHPLPTLPPIIPLSSEQSPLATSSDTSPMPPRLRLLRRHEQSRIQTSPISPTIDHEQDPDRTLAGPSETTQVPDVALQASTIGAIGGMRPYSSISTVLPTPPASGARHIPSPSANGITLRHLHTLSRRRDLLHDMHNPFEPFELDEGPFSEFNRTDELPYLGFESAASRRSRRQPSSPSETHNYERPFLSHIGPPQDSSNVRRGSSDIVEDDHLIEPGRGTAGPAESRGDVAGATPWRHGDRIPGSFWAGIFDETDSERDGSPRRLASIFDGRRHTSDSERDVLSSRHPRSVHDAFRDDLRRRSSVWDSPRRTSGPSESDHVPHTLSSSSSSMSSYGRSTSRSLLDPTLSFGAGPSMNSRSSLSSASGQEQQPINRSRFRPRTRLGSWFDDRSVEEDEELLNLNRSAPGSDRRRGEALTSFSSFFSPIESTGDEDHSSQSGASSRHANSPRNSQTSAARLVPAHLTAVGREHVNPSLRSTYDVQSTFDHAGVTPQARSLASWESDPSAGLSDLHSGGHSMRRRFSPVPSVARHLPPSPAPHESDRPFSPFGLSEQPLPVSSRFRLRRHVAQDISLSSGSPEAPTDSMEDIIPESNARENNSVVLPFRRHASPPPFATSHPPLPHIEPPPRPVEPRLSSWDVGPRPNSRAPPRRLRSSSPPLFSPLSRQDPDSPGAVHPTPSSTIRPQRDTDMSYRSMFDRQEAAGPNEQPFGPRRLTTGTDADERRSALMSTNSSRPEQGSVNFSSTWSASPLPRHGTGAPRTETFNELVRRRTARAEAQAMTNRPPPSPDTVFRPAYRLPRPSFLLDDEDPVLRRDRIARHERRNSTALPGRTSATGGNLIAEDFASTRRARVQRQRAALLLERSISSRYAFGDRPFSRQEWSRYYDNLLVPSDQLGRSQSGDEAERLDSAGSGIRTRMLERPGRQAPFPTRIGTSAAGNAEESDGARERQELHDAIGRRSRDDELSIRRTLPNTDRVRHISPRDPMSIETTRNLQRRLRESEAEVSRALRALDQWGELEGSGERDSDPTQSRMHRFGETLRRRRVPPAFSFSDTSMDQDVPGAGSSSTARQGRRSPSPTTAATRLQTRQARFARVQGRFREMGTEVFGEPRSRSGYASRLDMLGGSRFSSRYITRNLGDYMRDEDFDASYENLVRLAAAVGEAKPRGTPAHLLAAMPTGFYKDFATPECESRCPICLDDYKELDPVLRISDCDHWFHKECLEQWLSGENSCPICRRRIRGRHVQQGPPDDAPGPSGSRRDDGSDDDAPGSGSSGPGRIGSPGLTLEELNSYAAVGW